MLIGSNPDDERQRAIVHIKSNLAPLGESIGFVIENTADGAILGWTGISTLTAGSILSQIESNSNRLEQSEAVKFLSDVLSNGAEHEQQSIEQEARKLGITAKQLRTARLRLNVDWRREGFGKGSRILWRLPISDDAIVTDF